MDGRKDFTTPFGGAVSLVLRALILWYLALSAKKMIEKEDAALAEVSLSLDLVDHATPVFNAGDHHLKIGFAAYYTNETQVCDEEGLNCEKKTEKVGFNLDYFPQLYSAK